MTVRARALGPVVALVLAVTAAGCSDAATVPADTAPPADSAPYLPATTVPAAQPGAVLVERRRYTFPVAGDTSFAATHHDYPATDIFADCGTPVVAPASGTIAGVSRSDRWASGADDPAVRGGRSWTLLGDDGARYYGSHLRRIEPGIAAGVWVRAGQRLGEVGASGNAAGTGCHLHFGISPVCGRDADWWVRRGAVPTYPYLRAWQRGRDRSPVAETDRWQRVNGCRPAPPD